MLNLSEQRLVEKHLAYVTWGIRFSLVNVALVRLSSKLVVKMLSPTST